MEWKPCLVQCTKLHSDMLFEIWKFWYILIMPLFSPWEQKWEIASVCSTAAPGLGVLSEAEVASLELMSILMSSNCFLHKFGRGGSVRMNWVSLGIWNTAGVPGSLREAQQIPGTSPHGPANQLSLAGSSRAWVLFLEGCVLFWGCCWDSFRLKGT